MADNDEDRLNRQFDRMERRLPDRVGRLVRWLRKPSSWWVRILLGIVLIVAGIFSFLPVLGLWMLPLGLLLLAQDIPFLRRPMLWVLDWIERRWVRWHRSRRCNRR
jgi:fatty acid desaturase